MPILSPTPANLELAVATLRRGELVAMPTETVYGLAADATDDRAVAKIYALKERPRFNPLIAHVDGLEMAQQEAVLDERALALIELFWPGPLTIVAPVAANVSVCELARAGLSTVALRQPRHDVALTLIRALGRPLAAPSANRSGRISPTRARDVAAEFGDGLKCIIDGGPCVVGVESTIVAVVPNEPIRLLRPGGVPRDALRAVLGDVEANTSDRVEAPGQLASHYAPHATLRLNARAANAGEVLLGFGDRAQGATLNLSLRGDLIEAAANLFAMLRALDATGSSAIAVAPIPTEGLGEAINDRLRRAASPRG